MGWFAKFKALTFASVVVGAALIVMLLFSGLVAQIARGGSEPIRVAVIDTGLDLTDPRFKGVLCPEGHEDFTGTSIKDSNGHGTHITGLIKEHAAGSNFCLIILKYYDETAPGAINLKREVAALRKAAELGVGIVNFSGGGPEFSEEEFLTIRDNPEITYVFAAGNENSNIDDVENYYYPASNRLPNIVVVGSVDEKGNKLDSSNYGKRVTVVELGTVRSTLPKWKCNGKADCEGVMTGTSQATAIHTGKLIKRGVGHRLKVKKEPKPPGPQTSPSPETKSNPS